MIVDINLHWYPDDFWEESFFNECIRCIPRAYGEQVELLDLPKSTGMTTKQLVISRPKGYVNLNIDQKASDPVGRINALNAARVDKAIVRWPIFPEWLSLDLCKRANDAMYKTVQEFPDRLMGIAIVPPWGDKECLAELDRCMTKLGCVGVELECHYGELYLDAEEFRPMLSKINEYNVPIIVHHTALPVSWQTVYDYTNLRRLVGRCIDQLTSVSRILYSGMLDEFTNLKFIHTMMAGGLFAFADLITPKKSTIPTDLERFDPAASAKVKEQMKKHIFSDISHAPPWGEAQLECAVKVLGAENVIFGSSYPLRSEWLLKGVEFIENLEISDEAKALILGGNAQRLFNIKD